MLCMSSAAAAHASEADGEHWRLETRRGPVHVWRPADYDPATAGIVVYVHGYRTSADRAWVEHGLPEQFRGSRRNALFIVPAAPSGPRRSRKWLELGALIDTVISETGVERPPGEIVIMGHSGAYRTMLSWLREPRVRTVILLDALYGVEKDFARWLEHDSSRRIIDVASDTRRWSERLARGIAEAVALDGVPEQAADVPEEARAARLLYMRAQYHHDEIVTAGAVIPLVLGLTSLEPLIE